MSDFEYWNPDHYVIKTVSGSKADCMKAFQAETLLFPYQEYGTTITSKTHNQDGDCHIVITRFKTKELCMKHVLYPPHYVRHGGKVL